MSFERHADDFMNGCLTYWPPAADDGFGNQTFATPELHRCRWRAQVETTKDNAGKEFISQAKIHCLCPLLNGGIIAPGDYVTFDDTTTPTRPLADPNELQSIVRLEIRKSKESKSVDGEDTLYIYWV